MPNSPNSPPKKPERYTAAQVGAALHKSRGMVSHAARALGCDPDTVRNYAKRHPTVAAALHEEREQTTDIAELALYRAIEGGEAWAVCFYLKTQGKARGYVERTEQTGRDGGPLEILIRYADAPPLHRIDAPALAPGAGGDHPAE